MGKRTKAVIICCCAVALVAAGIGVALWHPWDAGGNAAGEDAHMNVSAGAEGGQPGAEDEGYPGQSQGYVGPNGEGVIDPDDYASEEEYLSALIAEGGKQAEVPYEKVDTSGGRSYGYVKGVLIVCFHRDCGEERAREIIEESGGVWVSDTFAWKGTGAEGDVSVETYFPEAPYEDQLQPIIDGLEAMSEVSSASMNGWFEGFDEDGDAAATDSLAGYAVNDPDASLQYWLSQSGFKRAWEKVRCSGAVEVAVLDSGIDLDHPDLVSNIGTSMPYDAYNQTVLQGSEQDTSGHGTKAAGVVSAVADNSAGVAGASFNAKVIPVRVSDEGGSVDWYAVERAFAYLFNLSNAPEAINMSFSGPEGSFDAGQKDRVEALVETARDGYGMVCVATSGNTGATELRYPGAFDKAVCVASVDSNGAVAASSTRSGKVDVCAPGVAVFTTTNPDYADGSLYGTGSGTSFAAPQVAAAAALVRAQNPGWTVQAVEARLLSTAAKPPDFVDVAGGDEGNADGLDDAGRYGRGALDAAAAVGWTASTATPTSPDTGGSVYELYAAWKEDAA